MKYSDYSSLDPRYAEEIAYSRSLEEGRRVFGLPAALAEKGALSAALAEVFSGARAVINVKSLGAKGNGVDDDTVPIQEAIAIATAVGGTVYFPSGEYLASSMSIVSVPIPVAGPNNTTQTQDQPVHFHISGADGIRFAGDNAIIRSDAVGGGMVFLFDSCRDVEWDGIDLESTTEFDSGTGTVTVGGLNGLCFTSTTRDSERIKIKNYRSTDCYASFYVFGDPLSAFRVRGASLENVLAVGGEYGVATHNNGDGIDFKNVRVTGVNARAYFAFGVDNHTGSIQADSSFNNLFGLFLIKAYDRDTTNIRLKLRSNASSNGGVSKLIFQSQHAPAVQATPKKLSNIEINFSDEGTTGSSIDFNYFRDSTSTATCATQIFHNIRISGYAVTPPTTTVVQGASVRGRLNIDDLVFSAGSTSILENSGFYTDQYRTYSPALAFGGASSGIAYGTQLGEYFIQGNIVFATVRIILTNKGSSTGAATVSLPKPSANYTTGGVPLVGSGQAGMSGLTGALVGFVQNNASAVTLQQQGAAAAAPLTDANFTNTSDIMLAFQYPV